MLLHYDSAVAEARLLHSREEGCRAPASDALYFSLFRKTGGRPSQKSYRLPRLDTVVAATAGHDDTYISQSSFWSLGRKMVNFKQTRAAWVDLDLYNIDRNLDAAMVAEILRHGEQLGIPPPTALISSGRGCYLKWVFETPVTQAQLPVWQSLQATLTAAYKSLAADFKSRDASRVFRLIDTKNSKSGCLVQRLDGCGELYDFGSLCKAVEVLRLDMLAVPGANLGTRSRQSPSRINASLLASGEAGNLEALRLYSELRQPIMLEAHSERSLNWTRFCDLRDLYAARGGIAVGQRDLALFWMLNFLSHAEVIQSGDWNQEITELLRAFPAADDFKPLSDGSMGSLLHRLQDKESGKKHRWRGIEVSPLYRPSNDFLIDTFGITPAEMPMLGTIICGQEKKRRQDLKVEGRSTRREERLRWRDEVHAAFTSREQVRAAGEDPEPVCITALARYIGVERTRVSRYWGMLTNPPAPKVRASRRRHATKLPAAGPANPDHATKLPAAGPANPDHATSAIASHEFATQQQRLALEREAIEQAIAARDAQKKLLLQNQILGLQRRWVERKLNDLIQAPPTVSSSTPSKESDMTSSALRKKLLLLEIAQGRVKPDDTGMEAPQALPSDSTGPSVPDKPVAVGGWINAALPEAFAETFEGAYSDEPLTAEDEAARCGDVYKAPEVAGESSLPEAPKPTARERLAAAVLARPKSRERGDATGAGSFAAAMPPAQAPRSAGTPQDKLRAVSERVAKLPPLQLASRASVSTRTLVEGGPSVPQRYPDSSQWESDVLPPGSRYSAEEWAAARIDSGGRACDVLEIQKKDRAYLVQIVRPEEFTTKRVKDGQIVSHRELVMPAGVVSAFSAPCVAMLFSDCIWVATDGYPQFPEAIEAAAALDYRVIRPRVDYLDPARAYRVGTSFTAQSNADSLQALGWLDDEAGADCSPHPT